jgi:hypothetical protein
MIDGVLRSWCRNKAKRAASRILRNGPPSNWARLRAFRENLEKSGRSVSDDAREALELLRAVIVYERHGLDYFPSRKLHGLWRLSRRGLRAPEFAARLAVPRATLAQMHLASATFRLPVALQMTIKAQTPTVNPFGNLWGPDHRGIVGWLRPEMGKKTCAKLMPLACCMSGPLGSTPDEELQHVITIVTVLRDDFGHGEEGDLSGDYMPKRQGVLEQMRTCRIVEAQTALIAWAIGQFNSALLGTGDV